MKRKTFVIWGFLLLISGILTAQEELAPYEYGSFSMSLGWTHYFDLNVPLEADPWIGTGGDGFLEMEMGLVPMGKAVLAPYYKAAYGMDYYKPGDDVFIEGTRILYHSFIQEAGLRIGFESGWYVGASFVASHVIAGKATAPETSESLPEGSTGYSFGAALEGGYDIRLGKRSFLPIGIKANIGLSSLEDNIPMEFGLSVGYKHRFGN